MLIVFLESRSTNNALIIASIICCTSIICHKIHLVLFFINTYEKSVCLSKFKEQSVGNILQTTCFVVASSPRAMKVGLND